VTGGTLRFVALGRLVHDGTSVDIPERWPNQLVTALAVDGLHPSGEQCSPWVDRIQPAVEGLLHRAPKPAGAREREQMSR
jgi:hypothetical protein